MVRPLVAVEAVPGPALSHALRAALDGSGPAVLPVPSDPVLRERVLAAVRPQEPVEDEVCLVVPTSGSTGSPKGVLLTAACLRASADAALERLGGPGRWWLTLPVTHIGGLQVVLRSGFEPSLDPAGCRYCSLVPTQLQRMMDDPRLRSFEAILLGGAAAPPSLLDAARARGLRVVTTYGMSETSGGCVYDGVPLAGVSLSVTDRIVLSGPVVALGYRFGSRFDGTFVTSDVGALVDGRLEVLGRADDMVITGGEKVAPLAVEAALLEHPSVVEAAVLGVPDAEWGSAVVACVVTRAPLGLDEAREWVADRVSRVAAPRRLVVLAALPILPGGKVDRVQLRSELT
ncbi:MAG: AMP-dependent synthetase [Frankiales bacterium]|nr:AMP-dependent synthetase [Frankiales bacterium]